MAGLIEDDNMIIKICELLLNIADRDFYQQEIIQIV